MSEPTEQDADMPFHPLRLCCCPGHLDGLNLDEMAALGAPYPMESMLASDGTPQLHNGNPYRRAIKEEGPNAGCTN